MIEPELGCNCFISSDFHCDLGDIYIIKCDYLFDMVLFCRTMLIANAGDSRAVLGKRGRAIELSRDHKPNCTSERLRIEKLGGVIYDGYLNGQLSVAVLLETGT